MSSVGEPEKASSGRRTSRLRTAGTVLFLGLFCVVAILEWHSRKHYRSTLAAIGGELSAHGDLSKASTVILRLPEAEKLLSGCPMTQTIHILNQFDIPKGAAQRVEHDKEVYDYTLWTSAADLKNLPYDFRTFENSRIRMVDMKAVDLDAKAVKTISMKGAEQIEDVSGKAKWKPR